MGITKTEIFTKEQNKIATIAKVLGHPARIAILQHLIKKQTCICGEIVDEIGLSQSTISQHLKELKRVNLIIGSIDGTKVCYCINPNMYNEIKTMFDNFFNIQISNKKAVC